VSKLDLREAFVKLKQRPTPEKLNVFYEYLVCIIEDLQDEVRSLRNELTGDGRLHDKPPKKDDQAPPSEAA
jgi:hypothetical protein